MRALARAVAQRTKTQASDVRKGGPLAQAQMVEQCSLGTSLRYHRILHVSQEYPGVSKVPWYSGISQYIRASKISEGILRKGPMASF